MNDDDSGDLLDRSFSAGGCLLIHEHELGPKFFDLSSGVAGELMQKFVNYQQRLAIVISQTSTHSQSFQELMLEHQQHSAIRFFEDEGLARNWLNEDQRNQLQPGSKGVRT